MSSPDRCGYTWPEDHEVDDTPDRQSCCWRETVSASADRCLLHVDTDVVEKDAESIVESLLPTETGRLVLDGADLSGLEIGYHTPSTAERSGIGFGSGNLSSTDNFESAATEQFVEQVFTDPDRAQEALETLNDEERHPFERALFRESDLSGANFWRTSLAGANLRDADLSEGEFNGTDFSEGHLDGADFSGATIDEADFSNATLVAADFSSAELGSVDFTNADLKYADFSNASLESADLSNADFRDADFSDTYFSFVDVNGANIGFADLSNTTF